MVQTRRREIIDDTLVTEAVFDMTPEQIMKDGDDPEGIRIGDEAAEAIRQRLREGRYADEDGSPPLPLRSAAAED